MRSIAPAAEYAPIFNWSPPRSRKISLLSFLAASLLLHLFCFYIFQIIYPPTVALVPPPARVNMINPDSEEGRVLLRWLEAEDPALASITQRNPENKDFALPKLNYQPSYLSHRPALRELPARESDLSVPSSRPPAPVSFLRAAPPVQSLVRPTEITFGAEADSLGAAKFSPREFQNATSEAPQPASFRVAINRQGEVRYCMLDESSGNSALDQQARRHLLRVRFSDTGNAGSDELLWTTATFDWGNDLALPSPAPKASAP